MGWVTGAVKGRLVWKRWGRESAVISLFLRVQVALVMG